MAETILRKDLKQPFIEEGIEESNFFNGRLLTAADLTTLQKSSRRRSHQLSLGLGAGVAAGLEVSLLSNGADGRPPVLAVTKGLAFNRLGQAVALSLNAEVALAKEQPTRLPETGFFPAPCLPPQLNGKLVPGKGAYLFVARPANAFRGQAPRRGFGQAARVEACDRDLQVEGVIFRLVSVDVNDLERLPETTRDDLKDLLAHADDGGSAGAGVVAQQALHCLRNRLAHACLGTEELAGFAIDPFNRQSGASPLVSYGVVDDLEAQGLLDACDVPLALVLWTITGVKWVDMWSVRRRLHPQGPSTAWPLPHSLRRQAEGEAMFLQFQAQLAALIQGTPLIGPPATITAAAYFRYLPAAGLLPVGGVQGARGFLPVRFFADLTTRSPVFQPLVIGSRLAEPLVIEAAQLHTLLQQSLAYPPIDLAAAPPGDNVLIWLYAVRENMQAVESAVAGVPQPYLVFTSGYMPNMAEARFNVNRWNYSNFA